MAKLTYILISFFIAVSAIAQSIAQNVTAVQCGKNEALTSCPGCEPTCEQRNPICALVCRLGQECQCQKGFYRNSQGKCVSAAECDSTNNNSSTSCPKNEIFMECGGCEGSCSDHNPMCTLQCRPAGCYCPVGKGFVRGPKGKCIHRSLCQRRGPRTTEAPTEEYNPCAATSCMVGSVCEPIPGSNPPQARCVAPTKPTCDLQCPAGEKCVLQEVQCIRAPCPPQPTCQKVNDTQPGVDKCALIFCTADSTCVNGTCVPIDRPTRATNETNPSCVLPCPLGQKCVLKQVQCIRAPCPPQPTCENINGTQPGLDKCALILCAANSRCVDGACIPIDSQPTDRCAVMRCMAGTRCIDGRCVPDDSQQDPCARITCPSNTTCEKVQVNCIQAPCPPQGRCVPLNQTSNPDEPQITCETVDCQSGFVCRMKVVFCIRAPCPPMPECVPQTEDLQISDPCATMDCAAGFKCTTFRQNCVMAPCPVVPVEGRCVPINETNGNGQPEIPRPSRDAAAHPEVNNPCAAIRCAAGTSCQVQLPKCMANATDCGPRGVCLPDPEVQPNNDPCMTVKCSAGFHCAVVMPSCIEGTPDCGPRGVCVNTTQELSASTPFDGPSQNIPNNFCMTARCTHGCITTGIKCNENGSECEYLGQCTPEDLNVTSIKVCENSVCPKNQVCEEEVVQCFAPPCLPIPRCVPQSSSSNSDVCAKHTCPEGQECHPIHIRCNRIVKNCNPIPACRNKKKQQ